MKDLISKISGFGALGALGALLYDVYEKGTAAYAVCAPVLTPVYLSVLALFAYFAKSPLTPKK